MLVQLLRPGQFVTKNLMLQYYGNAHHETVLHQGSTTLYVGYSFLACCGWTSSKWAQQGRSAVYIFPRLPQGNCQGEKCFAYKS